MSREDLRSRALSDRVLNQFNQYFTVLDGQDLQSVPLTPTTTSSSVGRPSPPPRTHPQLPLLQVPSVRPP